MTHSAVAAQTASGTSVPARFRIAAGIVILAAVGIVAGTVAAIDALQAYQVVLNVVGAGAIGGAAFGLYRGRTGWDGRRLTVLLAWIAAFGITMEAGSHQNAMNVTDELGATSTDYFLPPIVWLGLIALFAVAIVVTLLTKRGRSNT